MIPGRLALSGVEALVPVPIELGHELHLPHDRLRSPWATGTLARGSVVDALSTYSMSGGRKLPREKRETWLWLHDHWKHHLFLHRDGERDEEVAVARDPAKDACFPPKLLFLRTCLL